MTDFARNPAQGELTALAICPSRELSQAFAATLPQTRAFHILAELKAYPPPQALDIRLRQLRPDAVIIDLASDLDQATQIIEYISGLRPPIFVVGLHQINDSEAILRSLRAGATEFLYYPFDIDLQREAIARILRLRQPSTKAEAKRGKLVAFTSAKPGSGSSTLASQVGHSLGRASSRVLVADFDQWAGTVGFYFKVSHWYSLADAVRQIREKDTDWASLVVNAGGVDVLPAPDTPKAEKIDANQLHDLFEYVRSLYDYVVVDLPTVFDPLSLATLASSDDAFLVTTAEMPSLHLARRAIQYLMAEAGLGQERYRVVVNRLNKQDSMTREELTKIFGAPVFKTLPNDYLALHKAMTVGQPLGVKSPLGRSIEELAQHVAGKEARRQ